jgi:pimeloyl-ACP methyl ester carboxylesterase
MTALVIIFGVLCAGGVVTLIGTRVINRIHRPRGRFIDVGGFPQHVIDMAASTAAPDAPAVVVLHGAGSNLEDMYLALGERLTSRHRVIFVDRPGLGFSARKAGEGSSPSDQAAVLRDVLDTLGVDRVIVVGHSWGGTLALTFALDFPERVAGLVLVAPATHPGLWPMKRLNALLAGPLGWLFARTLAFPFGVVLMWPGSRTAFLPQKIPDGYVKRSAAMLVLRPVTLMANWADVGCLEAFLERQIERYGALAAPTVVLAGDRDPLVPPARHCEQLAAAAPHVKVVMLPGFGHMLHHAAADRVAAAVEEVSVGASAGAERNALRMVTE